ncbi:MAG TPA: GNAT family N-acetyltransferase [Solirubrobacterales bacterium]|jgi:GNAT superfamily N-acetyltransferase|nr:GNAT family N-acetyltransferase [Solirubrobacterales bacterium]
MATAMKLRIRPAAEDDCQLLVELIGELASYEKLEEKAVGDAETLRRTLFEERAAEALILETSDGDTVGYAIFFTTFSSFECRSGIWLEDVYVRPEHRRGGIGRAVMAHLATLALERGHVRFEWCALDWNEPALNFYDGLGATRLEEWTTLRLERPEMEALSSTQPPPPPA